MPEVYQAKLFLEHATGFSMDALHVVLGVALQLFIALWRRWPLASWRPWLVVLAVAALNEANDLFVEQWPEPGMQYGESMKDLLLTMILPTLLLLAVRRWPDLFTAAAGRSPED